MTFQILFLVFAFLLNWYGFISILFSLLTKVILHSFLREPDVISVLRFFPNLVSCNFLKRRICFYNKNEHFLFFGKEKHYDGVQECSIWSIRGQLLTNEELKDYLIYKLGRQMRMFFFSGLKYTGSEFEKSIEKITKLKDEIKILEKGVLKNGKKVKVVKEILNDEYKNLNSIKDKIFFESTKSFFLNELSDLEKGKLINFSSENFLNDNKLLVENLKLLSRENSNDQLDNLFKEISFSEKICKVSLKFDEFIDFFWDKEEGQAKINKNKNVLKMESKSVDNGDKFFIFSLLTDSNVLIDKISLSMNKSQFYDIYKSLSVILLEEKPIISSMINSPIVKITHCESIKSTLNYLLKGRRVFYGKLKKRSILMLSMDSYFFTMGLITELVLFSLQVYLPQNMGILKKFLINTSCIIFMTLTFIVCLILKSNSIYTKMLYCRFLNKYKISLERLSGNKNVPCNWRTNELNKLSDSEKFICFSTGTTPGFTWVKEIGDGTVCNPWEKKMNDIRENVKSEFILNDNKIILECFKFGKTFRYDLKWIVYNKKIENSEDSRCIEETRMAVKNITGVINSLRFYDKFCNVFSFLQKETNSMVLDGFEIIGGKIYVHCLDPIEIFNNCLNETNYPYVVKNNAKIQKENLSSEICFGHGEIYVNSEDIYKLKMNCSFNIKFLPYLIFHQIMFFKGSVNNFLFLNFIPGEIPKKDRYGMQNKQYKVYTSDLSRLFVWSNQKPIYRITMCEPSKALKNTLEINFDQFRQIKIPLTTNMNLIRFTKQTYEQNSFIFDEIKDYFDKFNTINDITVIDNNDHLFDELRVDVDQADEKKLSNLVDEVAEKMIEEAKKLDIKEIVSVSNDYELNEHDEILLNHMSRVVQKSSSGFQKETLLRPSDGGIYKEIEKTILTKEDIDRDLLANERTIRELVESKFEDYVKLSDIRILKIEKTLENTRRNIEREEKGKEKHSNQSKITIINAKLRRLEKERCTALKDLESIEDTLKKNEEKCEAEIKKELENNISKSSLNIGKSLILNGGLIEGIDYNNSLDKGVRDYLKLKYSKPINKKLLSTDNPEEIVKNNVLRCFYRSCVKIVNSKESKNIDLNFIDNKKKNDAIFRTCCIENLTGQIKSNKNITNKSKSNFYLKDSFYNNAPPSPSCYKIRIPKRKGSIIRTKKLKSQGKRKSNPMIKAPTNDFDIILNDIKKSFRNQTINNSSLKEKLFGKVSKINLSVIRKIKALLVEGTVEKFIKLATNDESLTEKIEMFKNTTRQSFFYFHASRLD